MIRLDVKTFSDKKLLALKPIVVLERLSFVDSNNVRIPIDNIRRITKRLNLDGARKPRDGSSKSSLVDHSDKMKNESEETTIRGIESSLDTAYTRRICNSKDSNLHCKKVPQSTKLANIDERPFKCTECTESFHTKILLAVHRRLHEQDSEDGGDVLEISPGDINSTGVVSSNTSGVSKSLQSNSQSNQNVMSNVPSSTKTRNLPLQKSNKKSEALKQSFQNPVIIVSKAHKQLQSSQVVSKHNLRQRKTPTPQNNKIRSLTTNSSTPECNKFSQAKSRPSQTEAIVITPCVTDHDYSARSPAKCTVNLVRSYRGNANSNSKPLIHCKECPASFSKQWYLHLHMILLHFSNKNVLNCPGCLIVCEKEEQLRQHIWRHHFADYNIMNNEISNSVGMTIDALTGENVKSLKRKPLPEKTAPEKLVSNALAHNISCNWNKASPSQRDIILDLIEAELRHIILDRNKIGDHFCYADLQRLSLQICESLRISNFFDNKPTKRWAQRILGQVRQTPRAGRYRFVHNSNSSYLNAVVNLSARGLSETTIFYAFEARLCDEHNGTIKTVTKTPFGATSPDVIVDNTVCSVLCTNANGSIILPPTIIFREHIVDIKTLHKTRRPPTSSPSKDFLENDYFKEWFTQFLLSIPPTRPVLLLVEGHVSQLSYSIIMMARENDIHIVFLPSRKRFVHSHQLIREALLTPLIDLFDAEVVKFLEQHKLNALQLKDFHIAFEPAWAAAFSKAEILQSFQQAGFLPLPTSLQPLEAATRVYLQGVLAVQGRGTGSEASGNSGPVSALTRSITLGVEARASHLPPAQDSPASPPPPSPRVLRRTARRPADEEPSAQVGGEPRAAESGDRGDALKVKEEPADSPASPDQDDEAGEGSPEPPELCAEYVKEEPMDVVKEEPDEQEEYECFGCNQMFIDMKALADHSCHEILKEEDPLIQDNESVHEYSCPDCDRDFDDGSLLKNHVCSGSSCDYSCPTCKAPFSSEEDLLNHNCRKNQQGAADHECDLHTCPACSMSFAMEATLQFHLATAHQNRPLAPLTSLPIVTGRRDPGSTSQGSGPPSSRRARKRARAGNAECGDGPSASKKLRQVTILLQNEPASPASSSSTLSAHSSRTLTASPSDTVWSDDEGPAAAPVTGSPQPAAPAALRSQSGSTPEPPRKHDYVGRAHVKAESQQVFFVRNYFALSSVPEQDASGTASGTAAGTALRTASGTASGTAPGNARSPRKPSSSALPGFVRVTRNWNEERATDQRVSSRANGEVAKGLLTQKQTKRVLRRTRLVQAEQASVRRSQ